MDFIMNNIYYVYALIDPRTDMPFYIGKGKNNRLTQHLREATTGSKKNNRITEIRNAGSEPYALKLLENLAETDAYRFEEDIIATLGREEIDENGILTNNRLSAWAPVMTTDVRRAISTWRTGMVFTPEHCANLSKAKSGKTWEEIYGVEGAELKRLQNSAPKGPMDEIRKQNISATKKGMKAPHEWSNESRKKVSDTLSGVPKNLSPTERERRRALHKIEMTCPHCGKVGAGLSMKRWHFNNCKQHDQT